MRTVDILSCFPDEQQPHEDEMLVLVMPFTTDEGLSFTLGWLIFLTETEVAEYNRLCVELGKVWGDPVPFSKVVNKLDLFFNQIGQEIGPEFDPVLLTVAEPEVAG